MNLPIEMFPLPGDTGFVKRHTRRNGPSTSQKAAERARSFSGGHCAKIEKALRQAGPCTAKHLSVQTNLTVEQIARRLPDLKDAGRVDLTGREIDGFREWVVVAESCGVSA